MQQIVISRYGDPNVMELQEHPDPKPAEGEVLVRVEAAGINYADLAARMGVYPDSPPFPMVLGYEVSGVIEAVGPGVEESLLGKSIIAMTRFGGYSSKICIPKEQAVHRPPSISPVHGAVIPVTGMTAWMLCEEMGRVRQGDRVLVHSAGGGVGLMALDLILWRGGVPIGTASAHKHDFLRERGYTQLINYREVDYEEVLRDEPKLDLIFDPIGAESWAKGMRLLRAGGKIVLFGFSANSQGTVRSPLSVVRNLMSVPWLKFNPISLINRNIAVMGVNMLKVADQEPERLLPWLGRLIELVEEGVLRPLVHRTMPFSQAAEAHQILHNRENIGKVILVPDDLYEGPDPSASPKEEAEEPDGSDAS